MRPYKTLEFVLCAGLLVFGGCRSHSTNVKAGEDWSGPVDPVCGVGVPVTADAIQKQYEGKEFVLCSAKCADSFGANPSRYRLGYCACPELHPDCECSHCQDVKAGRPPTEPCDCD